MKQNYLRENVNYIMEQSRISAIQLSRGTNLPLSSIKKIRNGSNPNPTIATLLPIARFFKISIEELMDDPVDQETHWRGKSVNEGKCTSLPIINWDDILLWPNISLVKNAVLFTEIQLSQFAFATCIDTDRLEWLFIGKSVVGRTFVSSITSGLCNSLQSRNAASNT